MFDPFVTCGFEFGTLGKSIQLRSVPRKINEPVSALKYSETETRCFLSLLYSNSNDSITRMERISAASFVDTTRLLFIDLCSLILIERFREMLIHVMISDEFRVDLSRE